MQQAAAFIPRGWHVLPKQENNAIQRETENVGTALLSNLTQLRILDAAARSIINTVLMGTIGGGIAVRLRPAADMARARASAGTLRRGLAMANAAHSRWECVMLKPSAALPQA